MKEQDMWGLIVTISEKKIQSENVELIYIHTSTQAADFLTKAVGKKELQEALIKLGIVNIHGSA